MAKRKREEEMPASSLSTFSSSSSSSSVIESSPSFAHQLCLVSMNVAMGRPSEVAPPSWTTNDQIEHLVSCILHPENGASVSSSSISSSSRPHVLALQECPYPEWGDVVFGPHGYQTITYAPTHMGYTCLLVWQQQQQDPTLPRSSSLANIQPMTLAEPSFSATTRLSSQFPAAVATVTLVLPTDPTTGTTTAVAEESTSPPTQQQQCRLTCLLASVHLEPFADGSVIRKKQLHDLHDLAVSHPDVTMMIIAGDTNMRERESDFAERDLQFVDAWKAAGATSDTKFTWDTMDHRHLERNRGSNRSRKQGPSTASARASFNAYYGYDGTQQYNARYDRIYLYHKENVAASSQTASASSVSHHRPWHVQDFSLVANRPIPPSNDHFLSDHFGIAVTLNLSLSKGK